MNEHSAVSREVVSPLIRLNELTPKRLHSSVSVLHAAPATMDSVLELGLESKSSQVLHTPRTGKSILAMARTWQTAPRGLYTRPRISSKSMQRDAEVGQRKADSQ
jgi:hypothetical protein